MRDRPQLCSARQSVAAILLVSNKGDYLEVSLSMIQNINRDARVKTLLTIAPKAVLIARRRARNILEVEFVQQVCVDGINTVATYKSRTCRTCLVSDAELLAVCDCK